ncbi:bifunctional YncE family protein/alkaline phosphatase family protein [Ferruginibacter yonginensis]|uniref:Bifunctional YncE family protein/alkaline phosphatase family protein n=1 Tax=Ferruginibacter yonginensis TaxID=1310416 RepID=A0ABV8QXB9_9BACT
MKYIILLYITFFCCKAQAQTAADLKASRITLPNGWSLTPVGTSLPLGDLPLNMAVSKSGKLMAVTNNGQSTQTIQLIAVQQQKVIDEIVIPKSWYGLQFAQNEQSLYVSAGNDNRILKYAIVQNKLQLADSFLLSNNKKELVSPAGLVVDEKSETMYVVTKEDNSLYIINIATKQIIKKVSLPAEAYACVLNKQRTILYISCWGCDKVLPFDVQQQTLLSPIPVGDNPNEMLLSKNGKWLYVANANDNSVSIINTQQQKVVEVLNAALYPNAPSGSTTNGVALSADEKTLYIANADNNCLAVFDVTTIGKSFSKGFIPVGWYPTNVKVIGKKIWVTNGKGLSSSANPYGPSPIRSREAVIYQQGDTAKPIGVQYIAGLFKGTMSIINTPNAAQLATYSKAVYENTPYSKAKETNADGMFGNPIPTKVGAASPIKYVFYVIKENRTYDQILGDLKQGNGDSSLVLFGEKYTPNQHQLATSFVLLDNFYVDAEVSADGHNWSMGAYATDYLEKTWPTNYGGRGGRYDAEGNRSVANNKAGFIWDHCKRNNVTYRTYGEFADNGKANIPALQFNMCAQYEGYNMNVKDTTRFAQWKHDFDSLLAINKVPQLSTVRFGNDHTEGLRKGKPSPFAHIADNDYAVGLFIEYLSKSPIWNETAVFIVEDDAQNGADHVDAHRSTAYVAGGLVKRNFVDHTMYSTSSVLRTIELITGMPPMTQYDAAAMPMWRCFQATTTPANFTAITPNIDLNQKNTVLNQWQRLSDSYNFAKEDAVPDLEFNQLLWYAIKGDAVPFPGPKRAAFIKMNPKQDDDDDDD